MPTSKRRLLIVLALALTSLCAGTVAAMRASSEDKRPNLPGPVRNALLFGRYAEALEAIARLESERPEEVDTWLYLRGHTLALSGETDQALAQLERIEADHPESAWLHKSRFQRAELLRGARRYREAEAIYEAEAQRLRSEDRQGELADIYIRFGDQYSIADEMPRPEQQKLDFERARGLYARVLELEAPTDRREYVYFRIGVCLQSLQRFGEAVQAYETFLKQFDPEEGGAGTATRVFEARYRAGICKRRSGDVVGARRVFEDLVDAIAAARAGSGAWQGRELGSDFATQSKKLEGDARFQVCETFADQGGAQQNLAIVAFGRFLRDFADHALAPRAGMRIPHLFASLGRQGEALAAYDAFLARPLTGDVSPETRTEHAELMMSALFEKATVLVALERYADAGGVFADYTRRYPTGPRWSKAQQGIVEAEYSGAATHRREERFAEARTAWERFLEAHPLDGRARQIHFDLGQLYVVEAAKRRKDNEDADAAELLRAAIDKWQRVIQKYPGTDEASLALLSTGILRETELSELEAALDAYRACTFGAHAAQARARLEAMERPSLEVTTERSWRSDEPARVQLRLRNVENVQVQLYALDLEAYFRKHLTNRKIEDLDLDLIAADESFDVPIEDYAAYLPIERQIDLPVEGPGVWAVAVSDGERRATTLVVRSDIDVVVKSSRREVFVYAQDMRVGAPAQGTSVLVALPGAGPDGAPEMRELITAGDGVARLALEGELKDAGSVRVFAQRSGHIAAEGLELSGLARSAGLQPRGYVYTDRSAYRPGQQVRWRAILRDVQDGQYTFEPGAKYRVEIVDSQGRVFSKRENDLSEFGTLTGAVQLAAEAPEGTYTVRVAEPGGRAYAGSFQVQEFRLQKIELTFELERDVFYRGEEVEVELSAAYYYGEPVANSPVRYVLPDGRVGETRTDERGRATFSFETREFPHDGQLGFQATLVEEQVNQTGAVWLATTGFGARVAGPGRVVVSGEPFRVTVETQAPSGESVSRAMTLTVARRESRPGGRWAEVDPQTFELTTSDEEGHVEQTLALDEGGVYVLRAEGRDRFDNPVVAETHQFVSGDDDAVRLRLLTDETALEVGGKGRMRILNRKRGGVALVTFEGEKVLEYRLLKLAEGESPLEFDVVSHHFPNFDVSVVMMLPGEFLNARTSFRVDRELRVAITPESEVVAPGDATKVRVRATDVLGAPVRAELSLAVVDDALFEAFPDTTQPIVAFFQAGAHRNAALRTVSSCTFRYQGRTDAIAAAVLEERTRALAQREWDVARERAANKLAALSLEMPALVQDFDVQAEVAPPSAGFFFEDGIAQNADDFFLGSADKKEASKQDFRAKRKRVGGRAQGPSSPGPVRGGRFSRGVAGDTGIAAELGFDAVTAYWNAAVVTDEKGEATVELRAPDKSSRWRITARGVDAGTLVGSDTKTLVTRADFFVELRTPIALLVGDAPRIVARVHNLTGLTGSARIALRVRTGGDERVLPQTVELGEETIVEHVFDALSLDASGELELELEATANLGVRPLTARTAETIEVRPWGIEYADTASAVLSSARKLWLELPAGRIYTGREIELFVGPSVDRLLVDLALGRGPLSGRQSYGRRPYGRDYAGVASELLAACAVIDAQTAAGRVASPDHQHLREVAEARVSTLAFGQRSDGGWSWTGRGQHSQREPSCRVLVALARANALGIQVAPETRERGIDYLQKAFQRASQQADEEKAMILYALSTHGRGDFGAANRLHRARAKLSPATLAYTTLALVEMNRAPMAAEVAQTLESTAQESPEAAERCMFPTKKNIGWNRSRTEMAAIGLAALQRALPASPRTAELAEELLASRPWRAGRDRGMAISALAEHQGRVAAAASNSRVKVLVAGRVVKTLDFAPGAAGERWRVPVGDVRTKRIAVDFEIEGRGKPHVSAVLRGFGDPGEAGRQGLDYKFSDQEYLASTPTYQGRPISTGFNVLRRSKGRWTNTVENLELGRTTRLTLHYWRQSSSPQERNASYMALEVPLPAGTRVLDGSFGGALGTYDEVPGGISVPVGNLTGGGSISFTLIGAHPGSYRVLPPLLRDVHDPARMLVGKAMKLMVLERGAKSPDTYRPTPDELFHMGREMYKADDFEGAHARLSKLYEDYETVLRDDPLKEAANMLLFMSIDRGEAPAIVRYFEVIKERDPSLYVPFAKVVAIGEAYRALEEFERALLIFRATVEETFGKDLKVAGALEEQGEFAGAAETLDRLWAEYPDFPTVIETRLTLSDKLLKKAPQAHLDDSLKRAGRDRASLTMEGVRLLQDFLGLYPTDPIAPDAGLNLVSAWLSLEDNETASALAGDLARRFDEPRYADAFLYTRAVAEWYLGNESNAVGLLERIAKATYPDANGKQQPSQNRDLALYILGQIHHARQEAPEATKYYERVKDLFPDAREALAGFRQKEIGLPEVTTARPGEEVAVMLTHKNVESAELLVYAVDLMTLYLREKNLSNVTEVNLAGIAPTLRTTVELGGKDELRPRETAAVLELTEPGAYLVICRGDERHTSGLVLVSDLELDVREDPGSGRMRIQALHRENGRYLRGVDVRVIGSGNSEFLSGETDPRGLFLADGIAGRSTVIARTGEHQYAFHRGAETLGPEQQPQQQRGRVQMGAGGEINLDQDAYLRNIYLMNEGKQQERGVRLDQEIQRVRKGVQVQQVK
ncbi:MAG: outer membrane protein assembly factor BamD [bacterium]|nr:outer membrane protein assembly factor BamD [bacterium]